MTHLAALLVALALPHPTLLRSAPANDSRLAVAPTSVSLWFSVEPQLAFSRISLSGPTPGSEIALDTIVLGRDHELRARIPVALAAGRYTVTWKTAGADGHVIRGSFGFAVLGTSVTAPAAAPAPSPSPTPPADTGGVAPSQESVATESRVVRWFEFATLIVILGALGFRHAVLPPLAVRGVPTSDAADRARRLGRFAAPVYIAAAALRLASESRALHDSESALTSGVLVPLLTQTMWGAAWVAGVAGALLVAVAWSLPKRVAGSLGTPLALTGALGMVAGPALSGHAASSRFFVPSVTLDMVHVASAGLWIGGLLMVLTVGLPAMRRLTDGDPHAAVRAMVSSFHPLALLCAPAVVLAGVGTSALRLGSVAALRSAYGTTLLVKLALFAVVAGMGTWNALRGRRQLGSPEGTRRFRVTGAIELTMAALVLAATTVLVVTPVPSEMTP